MIDMMLGTSVSPVSVSSLKRTALVILWLRYNGQTGTPRQIERCKLTAEALERMLRQRGVVV